MGDHLRHWRQHRRLSQQGLALEAEISTRHLSYVETGRAQPSREMVLRLVERLAVPLRERNALLVAAGYAPMYQARPLDHPDLAAARRAVDLVLKGHEPNPALAVDRHWNLVAANAIVPLLLAGVAPWLLGAPRQCAAPEPAPRGSGPAPGQCSPVFISTITIFGTPVDVTLQELAVESFFPADAQTQEVLGRLRAVA